MLAKQALERSKACGRCGEDDTLYGGGGFGCVEDGFVACEGLGYEIAWLRSKRGRHVDDVCASLGGFEVGTWLRVVRDQDECQGFAV